MREHGHTTRRAYPGSDLIHSGPDDRAGRRLAFAEVAVEGLVRIPHTPGIHQKPGEMQPSGSSTARIRQRPLQRTGHAEPRETCRQIPRPFVTTHPLRLDRRAYRRVGGIEAEPHHVTLPALMAGTELDARQEPDTGETGRIGRDGRPSIDRVVIGDCREAHAIGSQQREQLCRREFAVRGVAVAVKINTHPKKSIMTGMAG